MTKKELYKEIDLILAENRAAVERFESFRRKTDPLIAVHTVTTDRLLKRLRQARRR